MWYMFFYSACREGKTGVGDYTFLVRDGRITQETLEYIRQRIKDKTQADSIVFTAPWIKLDD